MNTIESFLVNHLNLETGLYVSRKDECDGVVTTTFDVRFTAPNKEEVLNCAGVHTLEHLGATFLRNSYLKDKIIYFGPMGCRTGFYLVMFGDLFPIDVYPIICEMLDFIINYQGDIPGATPIECGNYSDQNLEDAKKYAKKYLKELQTFKHFEYQK
ncbi:MAG: S-ribosylhomocysteine lyase [Clostridia bacterium]|nr:S-ribosylhomocysteine lyase [Clostridia bacterium]